MRILLAQNSRYYPSHGGGDKSNRLLMQALAARGHTCLVVARTSRFGAAEHELFLSELASRGVKASARESGVAIFERAGVEVHTVTNHPSFRGYFSEAAAHFRPDIILASTDDPAQLLLEAAMRMETARVVYLARATLALPFGPDCAFPSESKREMLRRAAAVVGVSEYVAGYIRRSGGIDAVHVPISLLEGGPYAPLGKFENEFVTMVNPCAVKGISIFLALAERMADVHFAAVPMWGTNEEDRRALGKHANITILPAVDDITKLLARTRVLLVPSLWAEARSRIVVEAMLHAVPVMASNVGGIAEAKLGVDYLIPVRPIEKYRERVDEQMVPVAEVPGQDIGPWEEALRKLVTGRPHYEQLSRASRAAALAYADQLSIEPFERLLVEVISRPKKSHAAPASIENPDPLAKLSAEKRRLLALRLRAKTSEVWFPSAADSAQARLRLFCFPYAGGGVGLFRGWAESLPHGIAVCPARLPGRETRLSEPPIDRLDQLIGQLADAITTYLDRPFALFGHSLGAAIAFELARVLHCRNQMPKCLFVAGARAPQLRRDYVPPPAPSDEELLNELRRLDGIPKELLENRELIELTMPALRADSAIYRNYTYSEAPPLDCPIRAYGGERDERITRRDIEGWAEQTTQTFAAEMLPGGHFFPRTHQGEFLNVLARDLAALL
ncbi:MAG TPA: alpha/beta fold hydrolase [Bryobacteraceae bacterium]|nr:alpha/beta fold hydrolase [Bryobacteraceae bacterium]